MKISMIRCTNCGTNFGIDESAIDPDENIVCPVCEIEIDPDTQEAVPR